MGRRKVGEANVRTLVKNGGGSISVTLPIALVRELRWKSKQRVTIKKRGDSLIIKDWEPS